MNKFYSMRFLGTVEHVNYDRNGAHIRLNLLQKEDVLKKVKVQVEHRASLSLHYWQGYDYESNLADQIRSLAIGDSITVCVDKYKGFFARVEEKVVIYNHTLEDYEDLDASDDFRGKNPE